jgi:hypothetical protein
LTKSPLSFSYLFLMATAQIAPGGQLALPPAIVSRLRLRDGRPASLLQAELREDGVFLRPLEPRDIPAETLRTWIAEGESEMEAFRKGAA